MKKIEIIKEIVRLAVTVLTAIGAMLGIQSCTVYSGNNARPEPTAKVSKVADNTSAKPQEIVVTYKD